MMKDIVSIDQFSQDELLAVLQLADHYEQDGIPNTILKKKVVASLFFEASTRTRLSFESAVQRLGGGVIGFSSVDGTSLGAKGESFTDTIRMVDGYADAIIIRHPEPGSVAAAADVAVHPVLNAGDGAHEHPSQTLIDLFSIYKTQGRLEALTIAMVGDLKYGRVPHSLAKALCLFPAMSQLWVSPQSLTMPDEVTSYVKEHGGTWKTSVRLEDAIAVADVVYMTRVQKERFESEKEYDAVKDVYILHPEMLSSARENMKILHALPRRYELPESIDASPHAYYFQQSRHGVAVRAALLTKIFET